MGIGTPQVGTLLERAVAETVSNVPFPTVVNAGDMLVLAGTETNASATGITNPAGWTQVAQISGAANTLAPNTYVGIKTALGTEGGTTLAVTHLSNVSEWQILAFPGVDTNTPQDVTASIWSGASGLTSVLPSLTLVTPGTTLIAVGGLNSNTSTVTQPTGFTETAHRTAAATSFQVSYKQGNAVGATGTQTITWTVSVRSAAILLALRPAYEFELLTPTPRYY